MTRAVPWIYLRPGLVVIEGAGADAKRAFAAHKRLRGYADKAIRPARDLEDKSV